MKYLVVYDSFFGNTEQVARSIGSALGSSEDVGVFRAGEVKSGHLSSLEVLIVGSPTRAFSATKAINSFLKKLPKDSLKEVKVAAFDTRISIADVDSRVLTRMVKLFGYAAKHMANTLRKKGGKLVIPPEGFFVQDSEGPLKEGELDRAAEWAESLK